MIRCCVVLLGLLLGALAQGALTAPAQNPICQGCEGSPLDKAKYKGNPAECGSGEVVLCLFLDVNDGSCVDAWEPPPGPVLHCVETDCTYGITYSWRIPDGHQGLLSGPSFNPPQVIQGEYAGMTVQIANPIACGDSLSYTMEACGQSISVAGSCSGCDY